MSDTDNINRATLSHINITANNKLDNGLNDKTLTYLSSSTSQTYDRPRIRYPYGSSQEHNSVHAPEILNSSGDIKYKNKTVKTKIMEENSDEENTQRDSLHYMDTSLSSSSNLTKSLLGRSIRLPCNTGSTTRKCILTLDGYSYVIVASTPENVLKQEDLSASGLDATSNSDLGSATFATDQTASSSSSPPYTKHQFEDREVTDKKEDSCGQHGSTAEYNLSSNITNNHRSINGQIACHGALTIVRRSNSRKSFAHFDQHLMLPTSNATVTKKKVIDDSMVKPLVATKENLSGAGAIYAQNDNLTLEFTTGTLPSSTGYNQNRTNSVSSAGTVTDTLTEMLHKTSNIDKTSPTTINPSDECQELNTNIRGVPSNDTDETTGPNLTAVDLATENLPAVDTPDACDKAALRLRYLLRLLNNGEISGDVLQKNLHYAARVLEAVFLDESKRLAEEDDELSEVQPDAVPPEVREWLASTFTRQLATTRRKNDEKPKFRSVAHAIRAGIFVDRIYRRVSSSALMQFPPEVMKVLKTLDDWCFDVFALAESANGQPVKYLGYDLLNRYGIIHKFKIAPATLETFLNRIEEGYCRYRNPYHNNLHAADVTQTVHHMLCQTGLMNWLTDLEIYATLLAALIHDYEHTGTTNNFHVMSGSETALLYNDRAVLENHHVSAAFRLLKDDDCNILSNLSREEYRELRTLVIDMVLSTDMSFHFQQLKNMRSLLTLNEATVDKSKALALVLHCCDISHPAKRWNIHHRWTMLLLEEFFRQGDLERELGLPFSPLCDRNNTLVAESQIGFIDFIVEPSMSVMADMLEHALAHIAPMCKNVNASIDVGDETIASGVTKTSTLSAVNRGTCSAIQEDNENKSNEDQIANGKDKSSAASDTPVSSSLPKQKFTIHKPWILCLTENKKIWKEQAIKDAEARVTVTTNVPAQGDQITETANTEAN